MIIYYHMNAVYFYLVCSWSYNSRSSDNCFPEQFRLRDRSNGEEKADFASRPPINSSNHLICVILHYKIKVDEYTIDMVGLKVKLRG